MTDSEADAFPDILDCLDHLEEYKSVTDRYFSRRYCLKVDGIEKNDYLILFHSNRICLLTLAPSHFFFKKRVEYKVNFSSGKVDRLKNCVKGKGKKGGQLLGPNSVVCTVEYADGTSFSVPSCLKGTLVEVNEELLQRPELLRHAADAEGYLAVILSTIEVSRARKDELLNHEDYLRYLLGT